MLSEKEIREYSHHVMLFTTPLPFPLNFVATHPWLVTVKNGKFERWEVWQKPQRCDTSWGHVHQNLFKPNQGMRLFYFLSSRRRTGKLRNKLSGDEKSLAGQMVRFIEESPPMYHAADRYRFLPGPNSNTFVQWVINHFPESGFTLPLTGVGKNHSGAHGKGSS